MTTSNMFCYSRPLIDSDYHRIGKDLIQPFYAGQVQPASYDVRLHKKILRPKLHTEIYEGLNETPHIDLAKMSPANMMYEDEIGRDGYILEPGASILAGTVEHVTCPSDMICSVDGKSTLGRCFIAIHVTAGFIDPGFAGAITLEIVNHGPWNFLLRQGMLIGQLRFIWLGTSVERPYGSAGLNSHYTGSVAVMPASGGQE